MKTKLLILALLTIGLSSCSVQSQTTVYAKNSDISDNLDLRAVASMFGESSNLQDFERRLNDPKYQISNLDLNGDDQVDYLRVIESVEDRTHVVIIQAVLDRDVYQDVATLDVERDNYNKVSVQIVGNTYLYGANYIYEPVYNVVPVIYSSFWVTNYRPYYSTWNWNYYPTYYVAWNPYPIYRYRNNINVCINVHNSYNYVNYRRSYRAPVMYETRRTYGYERIRPNYSFEQRHANVSNRYDLDQRRMAGRESNRSQNTYSTNRTSTNRVSSSDNRNYNTNRSATDRTYTNTNRASTGNRDSYGTVNTSSRSENNQRTPSTNYDRNNSTVSTPRASSENRSYSNRMSTPRPETSQRSESSRNYSENRMSTPRAEVPQRAETSRGYSNERSNAGGQSSQRSESARVSQENRGAQPQREYNSGSRGGGRRG
ncbi:hypothetical protein [Flavobacterium sp. N2038]|uniref:hypothetical protein n=1 Tax=Flavobacterium sp. N2038 TaxID=2986829 RepID=UPI002223F10B|nr:hypothetical protein [Flavobacterium sp. N2038]